MKSIYSSKLYRASKRKDRIQAALIAPGNLSLVTQLAEDLDEEYKTPENLGIENEDQPSESDDDFGEGLIVDEEIDPDKDLVTVDDAKKRGSSAPHRSSGGHSSFKPSGGPDLSEDASGPDTNTDEPSDKQEPKEEPAEASTKVIGCSDLNVSVLKDSLNLREDTKGVSRVAEKDNEVWIYYKDDVNLNNIMTQVIEYLMNAGYDTLEFNRLARSDNAIVFVIINQTVSEPVSVDEEEKESN